MSGGKVRRPLSAITDWVRARPRSVQGAPRSAAPPAPEAGSSGSDVKAILRDVARELGITGHARPKSSNAVTLRPLVSVIIPVFNNGEYVEEALASVMAQTYGNWEAVVVDDASSDDSWVLIERAAVSDSRVRTFRNAANRGSGGARNLGIEEAKGEYLVFLDGDDLLLRESLSDRLAALEQAGSSQYVVGSFSGVRFAPASVALHELRDRYNSHQPAFMDFVVADGESPFTILAPLVETKIIKALGGFDESMTGGAVDWDLWYRLFRNGYVLVSSPYQGAVYRQRPGGITRGNPASHTAASARLIEAAANEAREEIMLFPTAFPMRLSLGAYRAQIAVGTRAVRFAAMALVDGDMAMMQATLSQAGLGSWVLLERHLDFDSLVKRGAARALGLAPVALDGTEEELEPFIAVVTEATQSATG